MMKDLGMYGMLAMGSMLSGCSQELANSLSERDDLAPEIGQQTSALPLPTLRSVTPAQALQIAA